MPVSIEELDATVRAFYEGRGEQVKYDSCRTAVRAVVLTTDLSETAKSCPSRPEPGTSPITAPVELPRALLANCLLQFKEDPDAWLMVDDILSRATYEQTKCLSLPARKSLVMVPGTYIHQSWVCRFSIM